MRRWEKEEETEGWKTYMGNENEDNILNQYSWQIKLRRYLRKQEEEKQHNGGLYPPTGSTSK